MCSRNCKITAVILIILFFILPISGCASILFPGRMATQPEGTTYFLDIPMLLIDVALTGIIGIVIDFSTGAIWIPFPLETKAEPLWPEFENPGQG